MKSSSRALKMAHIMHQDKPRFPWSELVKRAWYFIRFREWLKAGIVTFSFYKSDGSIREAKGTLHELLIPEDKKPKGTTPPSGGWGAIPYFDLDKQEWRSFNICNFIGFVTIWELAPFLATDRQSSSSLSAPRSSRSAKRSRSSILPNPKERQ